LCTIAILSLLPSSLPSSLPFYLDPAHIHLCPEAHKMETSPQYYAQQDAAICMATSCTTSSLFIYVICWYISFQQADLPFHSCPVATTAREPHDEHSMCSSCGPRVRTISISHAPSSPASTSSIIIAVAAAHQVSTPSIGTLPLHLHPVAAAAREPYAEYPRCSSYGSRACAVSVLHVHCHLLPPAPLSPPPAPVPLNTRNTE
jgi:hypothetical protein